LFGFVHAAQFTSIVKFEATALLTNC